MTYRVTVNPGDSYNVTVSSDGTYTYVPLGFAFASREEAEAAVIPATQVKITVQIGGYLYDYVRDATGTALTTADGADWSPADEVYPDHWATNTTPGTTNMTTAIVAAVAFVKARSEGGGEVRLRPTKYAFSTFTIDSNVAIRGQGRYFVNDYVSSGARPQDYRGSWLWQIAGTNADGVVFQADETVLVSGQYPRIHAGLYDLGINGRRSDDYDGSPALNTSGCCVSVRGAGYVTLQNVVLFRAAEHGIETITASSRTSNNLSMTNVVSLQNGLDGFNMSGGDSKFSGLVGGANGRDGFNGNMGQIAGSRFWNNGRNGISMIGFPGVITGCEIYDNDESGIHIYGGSGHTITGNKLVDNGRDVSATATLRAGIAFSSAADRVTIVGNTIGRDNAGGTPGYGAGDQLYGIASGGGTIEGVIGPNDYFGIDVGASADMIPTAITGDQTGSAPLSFVTRAGARLAVPFLPANAKIEVGNTVWIKDGGSGIADMPGCTPVGPATPQHFADVAGDGSADDYAACQAAMAFRRVHFPKPSVRYRITDTLTTTMTGHEITGDMSEIRQITTAKHNLRVNHSDARISGLHVYGNGFIGSPLTLNGGIYLSAVSNCRVFDCLFEGHRSAAVLIIDADDNTITGNRFINSPGATATVDTENFADIYVGLDSKANKITNNVMRSGQGTGVLVQTTANGNKTDFNVIDGNRIFDAKDYGVACYRLENAAPPHQQTLHGSIVTNNIVDGVFGDVLNSVTSTYTYGAGIYFQGAEGSICTGNVIRNTHKGAVTFDVLLGPGAIGVVNQSRMTIADNQIETAGMFGIYVSEANDFGLTTGCMSITGNNIVNTVREGIYINDCEHVVLTGNTVDTVTGVSRFGIWVNNDALYRDYTVTGNIVKNTTNTGIRLEFMGQATVTGNVVDTTTVGGIVISDSTVVTIGMNVIRNHTTRGIEIASTCSQIVLAGNNVIGTGSSTEGIRVGAKTSFGSANTVSGCTTAWAGDFAWLRGIADGAQVNTATTVETDLVNQSIAANTLTVNGETITLTAAGITANNANAKTLRVYFGTTTIGTFNLTISQISDWQIEVRIIRRGASAQRATVFFTQGGTTKQSDFDFTDPAETETSAIALRVTGQGTTSNDVQRRFYQLNWQAA
jgi:parallel beta-helix repeat protein